MRTGPVLASVVAAAVSAAFPPASARADDPRAAAARSFGTGAQAYAHGDFPAAGRAFDEAYRISPKGAAAYNAGLSWENAGEHARAADDYARALGRGDLGAVERADAVGRLRALERTLARVSLSAPPDTKVVLDDVELAGAGPVVHVEAGRHRVQATYADGRAESRAFVAHAGGSEVVKLGDAGQPEAASDVEPEPHPGARDEAATTEPNRTPAWIAFGGAVAASGLAATFYGFGVSARNDFVGGGSMDPSLRDKALALRTATWVSWGLAGALAATGLVLYLVPPSRASSAPAATAVHVDGRGVALHVTF